MASYSPSTDVEDEAKCPICRDYLTDPVTLDCGHNFCQGCIQNCSDKWEEKGAGDLECPVCRAKIQKGNFRPNWDLANISEKFKLRGKELCEKHRERLHLFCRDDKELVCVFCERSPEHESHTVVLKEEVVQEYKNVMESCLEKLLEERERILVKKAAVKRESEDLLKLTETERQKAANEFRQLRQFLKKHEKRLLNQMEKVEKEIAAKRDQLLDQISEELASLQRIIQEMEEKCLQPGNELLRDVRSTLQRYEKRERLVDPVDLPPELKKRVSQLCATNPLLQGDMKQFKDTVFLRLAQKVNVMLDPGTAYPRLVLSEDCKSVRWRDEYQHLPNNSERFYSDPAVLGREGFTQGSHYWEVLVGSEEMWAVGIARNKKPKRIRVTLNYDGREVSFFDADTGAHLYTFLGASFSGEMLLPFFWLSGNKTQVRIA